MGYIRVDGPSKKGKTKKRVNWSFGDELCRMRIRVVRFFLSTGELETIVTSIPQEVMSPAGLKDLYFFRWQIELGFKSLKHATGLLYLHGKKDDAITKEIYARLAFMNFVSASVYGLVSKTRKSNTKYAYRLNISEASRILARQLIGITRYSISKIQKSLSSFMEAVRPGRKTPRPPCCSAGLRSYTYR